MTTSAGGSDELTTEFVREQMPNYAHHTGPDRYARFCADALGVERTDVFDAILASLHEHRQTVVTAANGVGKSYTAGAGGLAALYCNPDTIVNVTAGNRSTLKTNIWKPARALFRHSILPGRTLDGAREIRTELHDEWFFECVSPRYPDDLEGPHNDHVVYVVEEADKPGVTAEHIESIRSTATDDTDRILVIANPPRDEDNIVYDLMQSDEWHQLQFASWDSHNVKVDMGEAAGPKIPGLVELSKLKDDWAEWHSEPWPGIEAAMTAHDRRGDLDERWYRRRAGVMPPDTAQVYRPFTPADARQAVPETSVDHRKEPLGVAFDIARRGGDWNVLAARYEDHIQIHERWQGIDHTGNMSMMRAHLRRWGDPPTAVDAQGEGSALADMLRKEFDIRRFNAGAAASERTRFYDCWTEGLYYLGQFLQDGGTVAGEGPIEAELTTAARTLELTENHYASRSATVLECSPKEDVTARLGRSPDVLDSLLMAEHVAGPHSGQRKGQRLTW